VSRVAVVLAAGGARRFGSDKLSAPFRGEPLFVHALRAACAAPVDRVILVAHPTLQIDAQLNGPPLEVVRIGTTALSDSLRAGIAATGEVDGVFVFLGDMPLVPHDVAPKLADRIGAGYAALPQHQGELGHPVLLSAQALRDVTALAGDAGAGKLLRSRDDVVLVDVDDAAVLADVDRPEDLARLS
jgi:molybdenum cofactor cytidylyltransferase